VSVMGTEKEAGKNGDYSAILPWLMAEADSGEWWKELRRNPKKLGEVSQAAFLLKARTLGFSVAVPWGDSERYDFVVWAKEGGRILRVQVKGTGRLHRRGYEVQAVRATRRRGKKRYTAREIDVLAAHVQPLDVWYLIPIGAIRRAKSLRFYPDIKSREPRWERYREAWDGLRG
jgi:PD-(D/E)XK nuclease superfamily protein